MARNMGEIAEMLENTRFRRRLFGGIDEDEVWKKLERLQSEYAELVETERLLAQDALNDWRQCTAELEAQLRKKDEYIRWLAAELPLKLKSVRMAVPDDDY